MILNKLINREFWIKCSVCNAAFACDTILENQDKQCKLCEERHESDRCLVLLSSWIRPMFKLLIGPGYSVCPVLHCEVEIVRNRAVMDACSFKKYMYMLAIYIHTYIYIHAHKIFRFIYLNLTCTHMDLCLLKPTFWKGLTTSSPTDVRNVP